MVRWPVFVIFSLWISIFGFIVSAAADDVILTIEGPVGRVVVTLTEKQIRLMPKKTLRTYDPWDKLERQYTGVLFVELLNELYRLDDIIGVDVIGRNHYSAEISLEDMRKYKHLLSYEMDGRDYSSHKDDDKGPLAVAVKMEGVDNGNSLRIKNQFVWWIEKVVLK